MTGATIDGARAPRAGEELDTAALARWLAEAVPGAGGQPIEIQQFPGGHSNLTYLVTIGERELVLRRPPVGSKVKTAHDMGREVRVLSRLAPAWSPAPRPIAYAEDPSIIGCPFYVMERKRGVILRREPPAGLEIDAPTARRLSEVLVDGLAELHAIDFAAIGLGDLGKPDGYVERQVRGWTERYAGSRTDDIPVVEQVAGWLAANMQPSPAPALIHNDFKYDNIVLEAEHLTRIAGVLDWEMATIGDPLMDLGTSLAYWVEARDPPGMIAMRFGPTTLPGMMTRAELAARYAERTGRAIDHILFYYAFGLFKTAVVAQQIYWRWKQGLTKDPRFEPFLLAVGALCQQAAAAIDRGAL